MKRLAIVAVASLTAAVCAAEPVGVPACDELLAKLNTCASTTVPAAQQPKLKPVLDETRSFFTNLAKNPEMKPQLDGVCKAASQQVRPMFEQHGCPF
jgi:hypothetical protein